MSHRLTIKGQVTIPKEIRDLLGLEEGNSCVEFVLDDDGRVTVRKAEATKPKVVAHRQVRTSVRAPRQPVHTSRPRAQGGVLALLAGGF